MSAFLKNLKLSNLNRFKLLINNVSYDGYFLRRANRSKNIIKYAYLATVAHQRRIDEDSINLKNIYSVNSPNFAHEDIKTIEEALAKIDANVRRTGRTYRSDVETAFSLFEDNGLPSSSQGLYLLRCCERMLDEIPHKKVEITNKIWNKLQEFGVPLDISHYNSLLKIYVDNNHQFSPSEFLASMDASSIQPNKVTYLHLLEKYCKDGNLTGAGEILDFMKTKGISANEAVFNALIKGYTTVGDFTGARNILEVMRTSNLLPTSDCFTTLACGYAKKGAPEDIESVLLEAQKNNISLTDKNYIDLVVALSAAGHDSYVSEVLEKMENIDNYRHDFVNAGITLIHKGMDAAAYRLILIASDSYFSSGTNLFIKQLIKCGRPMVSILNFCNDIMDKKLNDKILINGARAAVDYGMLDYAISFFEEMQKRGIPLRNLHFWPLFLYHARNNNLEGISSTLKCMFELGVPVDYTTKLKYVYPVLCAGAMNPEEVINKIKETEQSIGDTIDSLFEYYCTQGEVTHAIYLMEHYPVRVHSTFDVEKYLAFYEDFATNDSARYFKVLLYILEHSGFLGEDTEALSGRNLARVIQSSPLIFNHFLKKHYKFSERSLDACQQYLQHSSPELLVHLRKLDVARSPSEKSKKGLFEKEEQQINFLKRQGLLKQSALLEQLFLQIREKNSDEVCRLMSELNEHNYQLSPLLCARLLNLFCQLQNLEMVEKVKKILEKDHPTFKLDSVKIIEYATLLVKFSKFDDAIEVIRNGCKELFSFGNKGRILVSIRRLFTAAVETGNIELVRSLQNDLVSFARFDTGESKHLFLEPLIKLHLHREDLQCALSEYKICIMKHQVTPCLNLLLKKCILADDHLSLQKVIDMTTSCRGKHVALTELALSLIELGRLQQALKVMENLGSQAKSVYLEEICKRLYEQKRISDLEHFISIMRVLEHIDREKFFYYLFRLYDDKDNYKKAKEVWHLLQAEGIKPSEKTMQLIHKLVKNIESVPSGSPSGMSAADDLTDTESNLGTPNMFKQKFLDHVKERNVNIALRELEGLKKGYVRSITFQEMSDFLDLVVREKHVNELSSNVHAMSYIIENDSEILKPLLEKYSVAGDVDALNALASFLPDFTLKKISFNTFLGRSYISCGKCEDLLSTFEKHCDKKNKLFTLSAFMELLKIPELEERTMKLAEKYWSFKFELPIAAIWANYLINENYEKADEIYKLYSVPVDKVDTMIIRAIREKEDVSLAEKYKNILNQRNVTQRFKERAYGALLDVLVAKGMYDEASHLVKESEANNVPLHMHFRSTLLNLKTALERENKLVPFSIPSEGHDAKSSSASE